MRFLRRRNALKYVCGRDTAPDSAGGAHSAPQDLLAALRNAICKGRKHMGKEMDRRKGKEDRRSEGQKREGA